MREPASLETRIILVGGEVCFGRALEWKRDEIRKGGAMAEVVYVATSASQLGLSKDSRWKIPAVMKIRLSGVEATWEARAWPQVGWVRSIWGIHFMLGEVLGGSLSGRLRRLWWRVERRSG